MSFSEVSLCTPSLKKSDKLQMNISLSLLFTFFTYFTYFQGISYKKSRAYPSVFSAELVSKYAKVPCYAHHCYEKDKFQMDASLFWLFLILSDSAISKKFLVKKSKAYPTGFSSEPASKIPEVPPSAYHCYTKVRGFR